MRARHGARFARVSLVTVFLLQGAIMWVVSLPLQAGAALGHAAPLGPLDALGALVVAAGVAVEALADAQLARFLAEPGQPRAGHGPRALGLVAPPQLLRGLRGLVGARPGGGRGRRLVGAVRASWS